MKTKSYNCSERDENNFIVTGRSFSSLLAGISYNKSKKNLTDHFEDTNNN